MYKLFLKRFSDIILSLLVLIITLPITLIVFIILLYQNKGAAFFYQERPGLHQKPFRIVKFKTMTDARNSHGVLLPDNQRITRAGKIIRQFSLDELPQLFNVIRGDMSLIGPRPLLFKYIPLYNETQLRRHELRPGITGWAQVNGRNSITWEQKFSFDIFYVDNVSLILDAKIFWLTALKVIQRDGINQSDERPMQPFNGNN